MRIKRDKSIDASKGLAMLMIVAGHIYWMVMHSHINILKGIGEIGALNLYFCISGYLYAYRRKKGIDRTGRRALTIIGYLLGFSVLYCMVENVNFLTMCREQFRCYWFFATLLVCVLCEGMVEFLSKRVKRNKLIRIELYIIIWIAMWFFAVNVGPNMQGLPINDLRLYFPTYVFGVALGMYPKIRKYLLGIYGAIICGLVWSIALKLYPELHGGLHYIGGICGAIVMWWLCRIIAPKLTWIAMIGKNSLWIYGFHFYILMMLSYWGNRYESVLLWLDGHEIIEGVIVLMLTLITCIGCVLLGALTKSMIRILKLSVKKITQRSFPYKEKLLNLWSR